MSETVTATNLLRPDFARVPEELKARPQWMVWRLEIREGKPTKVPYCARWRKASVANPETWLTFEAAKALYECGGFSGVGFVFCCDDPYTGIDLDGKDPGGLSEVQQIGIAAQFHSYTERSPSGTGLHIIVKATLSNGHKKGPIEAYGAARYFTMTGHHVEDLPAVIEERQAELDAFVEGNFGPSTRSRPAATDPLDLNDIELLKRAFTAANGPKVSALWGGNTSGYQSASEADLALASMLAFWTGLDPARLERLMRSSGLLRGKWDAKHFGTGETYLEHTIATALEGRSECYAGNSTHGQHDGRGEQADRASEEGTGQSAAQSQWPTLAPEALQSLAGEIVQAIEPYTEADKVAVLGQLLAFFGCAVGRGAHFLVEWTRHPAKLFMVLVGETSKARKGTSVSTLKRILDQADPDFVSKRFKSGLSSGEGLIWQVRDPIYTMQQNRKTKEMEEVLSDEGEADKRLTILEPEFAQALKMLSREGNILSPIIRQAFDDESLTPLTKNNRITATGSHIAIIGHITRDELLRHLTETEMANGFANRFIFLAVKRSQYLPNPKRMPEATLEALAARLKQAVTFTQTVGEVTRDPEAEALWAEIYPDLSEGRPGLTGAILARGEAQVMRLALTYALLDCSPLIQSGHLKAALALWDYAEASTRYIFGERLGDAIADRILEAVRARGTMTETEIYSSIFQRNVKAERIHHALALLHRLKRLTPRIEETGGRQKTIWGPTH